MDVFDKIIAGTEPAEIILRTDRLIAFLDTHPLFPGHTLVCPTEHFETLYELPDDHFTELLAAARTIALAQKKVLNAQGTFIANNNVVSQSVPHFHLHVVPRSKGDGLRGFFWPRSRPSAEQLRAVGDLLRAELSGARDD
ncbi:HIT family protein [Propionimicrobium sp. PCR01-08-3]|uniref:HIT family protein n=1 Tax=Propionimicrobium sp. PCR01-08-3 TaxID=3052086 RepID=UPI00255C42DB|nr:HIT family protein [Propionimicrobium sp. PCR01-08-3]WIY81404.1 HIT family protein [Propionimicrobium sp. PCR01-08-3]